MSKKKVAVEKPENESTSSQVLREILTGSPVRTLLSILVGFLVGAIFMVAFNPEVLNAMGYFFGRPGDAFGAMAKTIGDGYGALFRGAIYNSQATDFSAAIRPITETLRFAAPMIMAGLGVGLGFRVGLFNIGAVGQMAFALIGVTYVATRIELPFAIHTIVAVAVAVVFAAAWGAIVGFLKARTGAHEVIVTIMLNYVALNLFAFFLRTPGLLLEEGGAGTPKSDPAAETAVLPNLFTDQYRLHWGLLIAIAATFFYWWLMERSTIGYRFRMVGFNSSAAKAAGIQVERTFVWAMAASAAFAGLAAANQGLTAVGGVTPSIHANIGFDAITVALLGGSRAGGIFAAGLLFGAFKAGGPAMQVVGVAPEILNVVQALIVMFIAAPPLIRALFKLPQPPKRKPISEWISARLGKPVAGASAEQKVSK
jgi:simple sugar transport system permease protein